MNHKTCIIIVLLIIIGLLPLFSSVSADNDVTVNIHMIGEKTRTRFNNPLIVAGIWHHINITAENQEFNELSLKFYNGESIPVTGERNATNYYEWKYDENNQTSWIDIMEYDGRTYIDNANCLKNSKLYSFCVGIKDTFPDTAYHHENWTLEIYKDEDKIYSEDIVVEKPTVALAKSHADLIKFNVDPFTEMDAPGDDFFIVKNTGNIPLDINIDYGAYNDIIKENSFNMTISPDSTNEYNITVQSEFWKPGVIEILGSISGSVSGSYIIITAIITFETSIKMNAPNLKISVGHNAYEITEIKDTNIVFQHIKNIDMSEGEVKDIDVYVSGNGTVTLDIWSDERNVTILNVFSKNQEVETPLIINSVDTSEYAVTVKVEAIRENKIGFLYYNLEMDGETQIFVTQISVGPPSSTAGETTSNTIPITTIILIICFMLVAGYMISSYMKHRRR